MKKQLNSSGFTLVELLIVMAIIAILAGMSTVAMMGAIEQGKVTRCRAQIDKIDQLINEKWNSYRFRKVPIRIPGGTPPGAAGIMRLEALRELQRFEMPDRISDVLSAPGTLVPLNPNRLSAHPSLARAYARKIPATGYANPQLQNAECLYLIISEMRDGERSATSFFALSEIGDTDGDGMPEILDPWGTPIVFLRWAPGYSARAYTDTATGESIPQITTVVDTPQYPNSIDNPDKSDPLKSDPRYQMPITAHRPFELMPLIFSAGPDRQADILAEFNGTFNYSSTPITPNDPYVIHNGTTYVTAIDGPATSDWVWIGMPNDFAGDGLGHGDNLTNHAVVIEGE